MTVTVRAGGSSYLVPDVHLASWICGFTGSLCGFTAGHVSVDIDMSDHAGTVYEIVYGGRTVEVAEHHVVPLVHGMAARAGYGDRELFRAGSSGRSRAIQAMMSGHQLGLFQYVGFVMRG